MMGRVRSEDQRHQGGDADRTGWMSGAFARDGFSLFSDSERSRHGERAATLPI